MKINDLSKKYNVDNKVMIDFLKSKGFDARSHVQNASDGMIKAADENFKSNIVTEKKNTSVKKENKSKVEEELKKVEIKKFNLDDMIPCKSVVPWKIVTIGVDGNTVYSWTNFGDIDYVKYKDLQSFRKTELITAPKIIIEDADLCYQWKRDLGDTYKYYLDVEYPEDFFEMSDDKFEELLRNAPNVIKEVIKTTALDMIHNTNYPSLQKLVLIDNILGTCIKDFI